jgi:ribonuclease HII
VNRTRIGIDENGLGSRLGPLIVTSVDALVDDATCRKLDEGRITDPGGLLDDSKRLVSHKDVRLGEAWARALVGASAETPEQLVAALTLYPLEQLHAPCPGHVKRQCWSGKDETFTASSVLVSDVEDTLKRLAQKGLTIRSVRTGLHCTRFLNDELAQARHRFLVDLHAMERLIIDHQAQAKARVIAVCGKVGGIADYPKFFGPLAGRLHTVVEQQKSRSVYDFPDLGELRFEQDADAKDPLVMIASLVGKYLREIFMTRIARFYSADESAPHRPSGYHDSVTNTFVQTTELLRKQRRVPFDCFERRRST